MNKYLKVLVEYFYYRSPINRKLNICMLKEPKKEDGHFEGTSTFEYGTVTFDGSTNYRSIVTDFEQTVHLLTIVDLHL